MSTSKWTKAITALAAEFGFSLEAQVKAHDLDQLQKA